MNALTQQQTDEYQKRIGELTAKGAFYLPHKDNPTFATAYEAIRNEVADILVEIVGTGHKIDFLTSAKNPELYGWCIVPLAAAEKAKVEEAKAKLAKEGKTLKDDLLNAATGLIAEFGKWVCERELKKLDRERKEKMRKADEFVERVAAESAPKKAKSAPRKAKAKRTKGTKR